MSLCPQGSLCISHICSEMGQLLRSPPTCPALIGCIAEVQLLRQKRLPILCEPYDPAAASELLCTAQWAFLLFLCCTELSLPFFFFFLSIMTLLRDAKGILLCSLCIEAFQFFTQASFPSDLIMQAGLYQQRVESTATILYSECLSSTLTEDMILTQGSHVGPLETFLYSSLVYKTCFQIAGTQSGCSLCLF